MKTKIALFPLIFGIALTGFATFSVLDTLVIEKVEKKVDFKSNNFFTSSSGKTSKSSGSKSSNIPSSSKEGETISFPDWSSSNPTSDTSEDQPIEPIIDETLFTDTPVQEPMKYTDHNIHIDIKTEVVKTQHLKKPELRDTKVYSADIYLRDLSHLATALAKDSFGENITEKTSKIAERNGAVFAINGDTYGAQTEGYVLRNGLMLRENKKPGNEDLVIYRDGSFDTFYEEDFTLKQIADKGAYQVFSFGPALVKDGKRAVEEGDEVAIFSDKGNQRVSIGMVSPLHYVVAVCDGRLKESYGMQLFEMADYMIGLGAKVAYNLDGGGSSSFVFNGELMNKPTTNGDRIEERGVSDIVYFA